MFGKKDVKSETPKGPDPEKEALKQELTQRDTLLENNFISGMQTEIRTTLAKEIDKRIDASVQKGIREVIVEKAIEKVYELMRANKENKALVDRLGAQAKRNGFDSESRKNIISAYLRPARVLVGRATLEAGKGIINENKLKAPVETGKKLPVNSANSGVAGKVDAKKVDWNKTSSRDFMRDNIVYKK
jgi:hypothetical protein